MWRRTIDRRALFAGRLSPGSVRSATALVDGLGHLVGLEAIGECAVELLTAAQLLASMGGAPAQLEWVGLVTPSMVDLLRQLLEGPSG